MYDNVHKTKSINNIFPSPLMIIITKWFYFLAFYMLFKYYHWALLSYYNCDKHTRLLRHLKVDKPEET
jgi:hypothetical protein